MRRSCRSLQRPYCPLQGTAVHTTPLSRALRALSAAARGAEYKPIIRYTQTVLFVEYQFICSTIFHHGFYVCYVNRAGCHKTQQTKSTKPKLQQIRKQTKKNQKIRKCKKTKNTQRIRKMQQQYQKIQRNTTAIPKS